MAIEARGVKGKWEGSWDNDNGQKSVAGESNTLLPEQNGCSVRYNICNSI